nr:putative transmembrane prediction protein [uncultured bacterium]
MAKVKREDEEAFGSDSFLDIVANMVGILIILVMVAGLRARNAPAAATPEQARAVADIQRLAEDEDSLKREVVRLAVEMEEVATIAGTRQVERDTLAVLAVAREKEVAAQRQALDERAREEFDLRRSISAAKNQLDRLSLDLAREINPQPVKKSNKIESYPTPISHTVHGQEMHFQLKAGRVTFIPMEELVERFKHEVQSRVPRLRDMPTLTETIGPIGDFRVRFTLERTDIPTVVQSGGAVVTGYSRVDCHFELMPLTETTGEPLELAQSNNSEFRAIMASINPKQTTVTLWTYPDSFAAYRALKKELYSRGIAVAGRPLPEGQPIGGSTQGTKSAAQ